MSFSLLYLSLQLVKDICGRDLDSGTIPPRTFFSVLYFLDSEISEDVVLQAEVDSRIGCLYYAIHEIERANNHLRRAIRLV